MPTGTSEKYDAIIIGAGIGGLVCGCYLAKAGMKVLICEQHTKPGGCCTSFKRRGFTFDAAAHSFGSFREGGVMHKVFRDLYLSEKISITKYDPSDVFLSPDYKISFWTDISKTTQELSDSFPHEKKGIISFFNFLTKSTPFEFASLRNKTFQDLLSNYFTDYKLKAILALPVMGNGGLPPSLISAFIGAIIYREFMLDGGYYPKGGMQALSDALATKLKDFGGDLLLSNPAYKIKVQDNMVKGIELKEKRFISSSCIISNCDARQTFFNLVGRQFLNNHLINKLDSLIPSLSFFLVYLGINEYFSSLPSPGVCNWILPHYNIEEIFISLTTKNINDSTGYMFRVSPDKKSLQGFINAPYKDKKYWVNNKYSLLNAFIKRIEDITPGLSDHIVFKDAATPHTLLRYTLNYKGAAYGWASIPSQLFSPEFRHYTPITGLFLTGHWTTQTQGIAGAAYIGYETAKLLLRRGIIS